MAKKTCKEVLVVGSKVRATIKAGGCMMSGDLLCALNEKVHGLLAAGMARAKANKRSTLRPQDL